MKKISLVLVVLLVCVLSVSAEEWINFNDRGEAAPIYDVTNSTNSLVKFDLEIPGMNSKDVDSYKRVNIPEHARMDSVGFPEVPVVSYLVAIPKCDGVNLNITLLDSTVINNINIYPAPEWITHNDGNDTYMEEQFAINNDFYNSNEYFPGYTSELVEKGAVRDQDCIRIKIYPVQFNPVLRQIIAYSQVNVEMTFDNAIGSVNNDVGIFNEVCGNSMINYNSNGISSSVTCGSSRNGEWSWLEPADISGEYVNPSCDYLIITNQHFYTNETTRTAIENLAAKRADYNGFDVRIVKMCDIESQIIGFNNTIRMQKLIKNTYESRHAQNTYDGKLGYVLLFGDAYFENSDVDCVPTHPYHVDDTNNEDLPSGFDIYFSKLTEVNGDPDIYPDILIGRIPVDFHTDTGEGSERAVNISNRIINYEPIQTSAVGYDNWNKRLVFSNGAFGHPTSMFNYVLPLIPVDYYTTYLSDDPYSGTQFNETGCTFGDNYSETPFTEKFFEGSLIYHFSGHGTSETTPLGPEFGWKLTDNLLENDPRIPRWTWANAYSYNNEDNYTSYPVIFNVSCGIGAFQIHHIPSFPEEFLTYSNNKGCIAYIGSSKISYATANNQFIQYLYDMPFTHGCGSLGEAVMFAKLKTTNELYQDSYNLLGDPALNIMLTSDNINTVDLFCNLNNNIIISTTDNQTLQITAGISNLSAVSISDDIVVECQLTNNLTGNIETVTDIIAGISDMGEKPANFSFDISDCMPTEFAIKIKVDPENLIIERNEENNEAETEYSYYKYQEDFPVSINQSGASFRVEDIPIYHNGNIILGGKRISPSGELLLNSDLKTKGIALPIQINETDFDYIIKEEVIHGDHLYRVDGNNFDNKLVCYCDNPDENYLFYDYCLGDLNNDGEQELICNYYNLSEHEWYLSVFKLDGERIAHISAGPVPIIDIAVGDGDNDGKNELYILYYNHLTSYDYNNGTLTSINQLTLQMPKKFALEDFNNDGELDCVIMSTHKLYVVDCSTFESNEINLSSNYINVAFGDIDNDGITELVTAQHEGTSNEISFYKIDIPTNQYDFLFTIENSFPNACNFILYDLNSDNQLDIIIKSSSDDFDDNKVIDGYSINGDPIFSIPYNNSKTFSIVADIDDDNDIELIFCEEIPYFLGQTENYTVSVSDLDIPVGNSGNIYPNMNKYNNNLYSQPVLGQLSENTNYHWDGSITLCNEVILPTTSTLTIQPGTIIKAKENSTLTIYGNLIVNGTENDPVTFKPIIQGASQNYWQGLEFPEGNTGIVLNHIEISNAKLHSERDITINGGSLLNTPLFQDGQRLSLSNVDFDNSHISSKLYEQHQLEMISIHNCHIHNSSEDPGIEISGYPNIDISDNTIENCSSGIKLWESGSGIIKLISNNIISNNTEYGIFAYHSSIEILDHNRIENNRDGIFITRDSKFNLVGEEDYPIQTIRNNGQYEVRFTYDSAPSQFYYNKIYDDNHDYSYVKCERVPTFFTGINIANNNWGNSFNPNTDLSPLNLFDYLPIWDPGVPKDATATSDEEMYLTAKQSEDNQNYSESEQTYKQIITTYPSSKYSKIAAKELLDLKVKSNQDFSGLKNYYETEPNMQFNEEMTNLSSFLINNCNIKLEEFQSAIAWFEGIIQNPPSVVDSVFAVVDAGYTYLLMENDDKGQYVGKIAKLKPKSRKEYEEKRNKLMNMLFGNSEPENETPPTPQLVLYSNYPNPFNPSTTISFSLPKKNRVELSIYNLKGQKVKTLINKEFESGKHSVIWYGKDKNQKKCGSGIYFYRFKVNGKTKAVKKCLLLK